MLRAFLLFALFLMLPFTGGMAQAPLRMPVGLSRPEAEAGPTKVKYTARFSDITKIESVDQSFSASLVLTLRWKDPRLAHPGPGAKQLALDEIWHPRMLILNETNDTERSLPEVADISPDGTVVYRQRIIGSFSQSLNLRAFPFDRDNFRVQVVFLGNLPNDIEVVPDELAVAMGLPNAVTLNKTLTIQDWTVESVSSDQTPYEVIPGFKIAAFSFEFSATRHAMHFVVKVILPLILIVAMSWSVFWIEPDDTSSQMGVSVTAMLTVIAYRFVIDSDVPKLPYLTQLDAFILMSSMLVFLSLLQVIVTTKFANRDQLELARTIDRRCRWIFPLLFTTGSTLIFLH